MSAIMCSHTLTIKDEVLSPPNPQEIHCFKWEFCVRFKRRFSVA